MNAARMTKVPENSQKTSPPVALAIAGFDPSSGAGITADLKTFAAHGVYGLSCATALTVQSTRGVREVAPVEAELVTKTLACLAEDSEIAGVKIGMLATAKNAAAVAAFLARGLVPKDRIVLDPLIRSSSGAMLLDEAGIQLVRAGLLAQVGWITPNVDELAVLAQVETVTRESIPQAARKLQRIAEGVGNPDLWVVVTGGHLDTPDDYLLAPGGEGIWLHGTWVATTSTHGTGCAFSSALVCQLIRGKSSIDAATEAKEYVADAMRAAYPVGKGRGPMHHLYCFDADQTR